LSDDQLLDVVKTEGDSRGSLRFFVAQHENELQSSAQLSRSEVTGSAIPPLRPKRRSRSRQNSVSSSVSEQPFELGYDADRDDDDSRKSSARQTNQSHLNGTSGSPPSPVPRRRQPTGPLPPHPAGPPPAPPTAQPTAPSQLQHQAYPPPLPQSQSYHAQHMQYQQPAHGYPHPSSPISQASGSKPPTPPSYFDRRHPSSTPSTFVDRFGHIVQTPGPPPPISPRRTEFSPDEPYSSVPTTSISLSHGRSNSDASAERDQPHVSPEQSYDPLSQRYIRQQGFASRSRGDSPRDSIFPSRARRADQDWASANGSDSNLIISDHHRPNLRLASSRHRSQHFQPKQTMATPSLSTANVEPRPYGQRPFASGRPIAFEKALRSKPPDSHGLKPKSSSEVKSLVKGKSMDNLRQNLPISKNPRSPLPQVPIRPAVARDSPYTPSSSYGAPKSYESPRTTRALPVQGSLHPLSPEATRFRSNIKASPHLGLPLPTNLSSPNRDAFSRDPCARPRSAADNHSPTQQRPNHSPSFGSNLSSTDLRSTGPLSPNRSFGIGGPRPLPHQSSYSDRSSDVHSGPETINSTPPRTPISPIGSKPSTAGDMPLVVEASSPGSDSNSGTFVSNADSADSAMTVRGDEKTQIQAMLKNMNAMLSQQHLGSLNNSSTAVNDNSDGEDYGDGGTWVSHGDGGTWIVAPKRPPSIRPELSKLRTDLPSDVEESATLQRPSAPPAHLRPENNGRAQSQQRTANGAHDHRVSGFAEDPDDWAPRPMPEDVLDRLEEFFPEHDLDRLVIEANSGGNSPVTVEPSAPLPTSQVAPNPAVSQLAHPRRHKKSIRIVAEEQKKRIQNRVSRADSVYANNAMLRKRNTKLWDSKVEEVDTMHIKTTSIPESPSSSSPSARKSHNHLPCRSSKSPSISLATFKWVRGELIGKGTYGRVYLALNATTGEMIAVKQVELPQTPSDRNDSRQNTVVQALKLESETLKDLDHPHIVQYLGFEETPANLSM
jgi:Protein kinase domain